MSIRWGIIGCGDVTEKKSGPAFYKVPGSSLVAVMRRNAEKAKDYALRHGVPKWYDDAQSLIEDPDVDAVYVATPPDSHEQYALASMVAGKPVYVEKPMSVNVEACERMRAVSQSTGVKLTVAHYRRAVPMFVRIGEMIDEGLIGEIRSIRLSMMQHDHPSIIENPRTRWRVDPAVGGIGGLFYDLAPHQLDLMVHYFGPVAEFKGFSANQCGSYKAKDIVTGIILFQKNILFNGTWCFSIDKGSEEDSCIVSGSKGKISFPFFGNEVTIEADGHQQLMTFKHPEHIQQPMIEKVTRYFSGQGENPCTAEEAIASMRLMEGFAG